MSGKRLRLREMGTEKLDDVKETRSWTAGMPKLKGEESGLAERGDVKEETELTRMKEENVKTEIKG